MDFAQEAEGSGHPLPVDEAHDCSLGHFECSEKSSLLVLQNRFYLSSEEEIRMLSLKNVPKKI